jgi:hypothetical protein
LSSVAFVYTMLTTYMTIARGEYILEKVSSYPMSPSEASIVHAPEPSKNAMDNLCFPVDVFSQAEPLAVSV